MKEIVLTGINIQWPISRLILAGEKTIETRTYPLPKKYEGQELFLIETPGKNGGFKSRIIAIVTFESCFQYKDKQSFYKDFSKHKVEKGSEWDWKEQIKWGWIISQITPLKKEIPLEGPKGIRYTSNIRAKV